MTTARAVFRGRPAKIAGILLIGVLLLTVLAGWISPHDPLAQDGLPNGPSSWQHWMGTDYLGRDTLSRLLAGARPTLESALAMVAIGLALGAIPGLVSPFLGRAGEFWILRTADALLTLPEIVFAIAIVGFFSNGPLAAELAIGVLIAPRIFRIVRAETLGFASTQYVEASALIGASRFWIIRKHVWRKVLPTIAVCAATYLAWSVLAASTLSFLGIGVRPPTPTWGSMLSADISYLAQAPYSPIWPGLAIVLTVWSFNAIADGMRDALGVRSRVAYLPVSDEPAAALPADDLVLVESRG